jgi:uncharacterized protein YndB with AHSA1/START domain
VSPEFTVWIHVSRPPAEVFEAVADSAVLSCYFTTGGAVGRLEKGTTVQWEFHDFPGPLPVRVIEASSPERIVLDWPRAEADGETNRVTLTFEPVDDGQRTKVSVRETGWDNDDAGRAKSYDNCMGWAQMIAALKAWLEYGINLRERAYK